MEPIIDAEVKQSMEAEKTKAEQLRGKSKEEQLIYAIQNADADVFYDNWQEVDPAYQDKDKNTFQHWLVLAQRNEYRTEWAIALQTVFGDKIPLDKQNKAGLTPLQLLLSLENNPEMAHVLTPSNSAKATNIKSKETPVRETLQKAPTPIFVADLASDAQTRVNEG